MRPILGPKSRLRNIEKHLKSPTAHPEAVKESDCGRCQPTPARDFHLASMVSRRIFCVRNLLVDKTHECNPTPNVTSLTKDFGRKYEQTYRSRRFRRAIFLTMMHP
jgi:hypothetical protein